MFDDYAIEIWYSKEDMAFLARIPELQGCIADGQTREEAIKELKNVFDMWIDVATEEGMAIPEPRKLAV